MAHRHCFCKIVLILQMILAISSDASSWNQLDSRFSVHSMVDHSCKFTQHKMHSNRCQFKNLNLRGGGSPFEDADGSTVNGYNVEENEVDAEEHGNDLDIGIPEGNRRNAAQVEKMKEQSRSIPRFGLCN
jgi:hypothetical protein